MGTISARVPDELEAELDAYLDEENLDRSELTPRSSLGASCFNDALCTRFLPVRRERRERSLHRR